MDISQNFRSPKSRISSITISPANFFSRNFRTPKNFGVRKFSESENSWIFQDFEISDSENFRTPKIFWEKILAYTFFLEFELCFRGTFSKMSQKMIKMLILRHQMRQKKSRGALFCYGAPRRGADGGNFFKKPQPAEGVPGGLPLVATILPENNKKLRIFVPNIRTDYFIVLDFCVRSKITKSPSIITETPPLPHV